MNDKEQITIDDNEPVIYINEGSHELAPNSARDGRDCLVNTMPVMNPVNEIKASDLYPTSKHWLMSSLNSNGGETTC